LFQALATSLLAVEISLLKKEEYSKCSFGVLLEPRKNCILDCSAPGAFSLWRDRYIEDSLVFASASWSSSQNKTSKDKSSRSPLRATTLESNVKKSNRVEFHEPLTSYRLVLGQLATKEKYAKIRIKLIVMFFTTSQKLIYFLPYPHEQHVGQKCLPFKKMLQI